MRWGLSAESKTNVAHMSAGDFCSSETSAVMQRAGSLRISVGRRGRWDDGVAGVGAGVGR